MKNKIKRFAKGDFHIPQPEIIFPETHIVMRVGEGEKYRGSFSIEKYRGKERSEVLSIPLLIVCSVTNKVSTGILSIYIIHMTAAG